MKRFKIKSFAVVAVFSAYSLLSSLLAFDWDIQPVPTTADMCPAAPIIALDNAGNPWVLYAEVDAYSGEAAWLKVAYNSTGNWVSKNVSELSNYFAGDYESFYYLQCYSMDLDLKGKPVVAFLDIFESEDETHTNLYLATYASNKFTTSQLTDDTLIKISPVVQLDEEGNAKLAYSEIQYDEEYNYIPQLNYGWIEADSFRSELVTKMVSQEEFYPIDMVLAEDGTPHIFYTGYDTHLWHAVPYESEDPTDWELERFKNLYGVFPSAVVAPSGGIQSLHVAYKTVEESSQLRHATNQAGGWEDELAGEADEYWDYYEVPSIAMNSENDCFIVWTNSNGELYDLYCSVKTPSGWITEQVSNTSEVQEITAPGHFFAIDAQGYGHIVYVAFDYDSDYPQIYYAKSTKPLELGVAEKLPEIVPTDLEIRGSTVHFSLPEAREVRIDLFDASGRRVECIASGSYSAGEHSIPLNISALPKGAYFVRGQLGEQEARAKLVLTK